MARPDNRRGALTEDALRDLFREMLLIRRFEEEVQDRLRVGEITGIHPLSIGQEAVAVGVCRALAAGDLIASTHRAHAHALARGMHPNELMAELFGKVEGCSQGYGGSMHLYDVARGIAGGSGIVGGALPLVVGSALSFRLRGEPRVAVAFFGDGATDTGVFHESLNLAAEWQVPALLVCEDNGPPLSVRVGRRAAAHGLPLVTVDSLDVEAVADVARQAVAHARSGGGTVFLHARPLGEEEDPLEALRGRLGLPEPDLAELEAAVRALVAGAVDFARAGADPLPEDGLRNVYA